MLPFPVANFFGIIVVGFSKIKEALPLPCVTWERKILVQLFEGV
jgi:hypothetical protein